MNADDNHDINHDDHCCWYDVISYPDLTLFYAEKGPLAEGGLGTRLDMIIKMITMMMIMITMMMTTTMIMMTLSVNDDNDHVEKEEKRTEQSKNKCFCCHL